MAAVDFYHVETGLNGVLGSDSIFLDNVENFTFVEGTRCRIAFFRGNGRGRYRLETVQPFRVGRCAGVIELDRCQGTVFVNPFGQFIETGDELLLVDAQLFCPVGC